MLDGLGMAETTPGPLIQVVQFVGFMGAYHSPEGLPPLLAAFVGATITTWVTFVPSFIYIYLGAPYMEALRGQRTLSTALSAITAAVVGVVLNLAVWFSVHVLFGEVEELRRLGLRLLIPDLATFDPVAAVFTTAALVLMLRLGWKMMPTILASAVVGMAYLVFVVQ